MIDRRKFFEEYKNQFSLKILKKSVVDCVDAILDEHDKQNELATIQQLAYMFATVRSEVGAEMKPIIENMCYSAERIKQVWPSRPEAVKFGSTKTKKCDPEGLANSVYANRLGNGSPESGDGFRYRGRGIGAQFTGKDQYKKWSLITGYDLINNPILACDLKIGAHILYKGSIEGLFTGRKLGDYINSTVTDYVNARRVVNADVKRMGLKIAKDAERFEACLKASYVQGKPIQPQEEITPSAQTTIGWESIWNSIKDIFK